MNQPVAFGSVPWTREAMVAALPEFASLYEMRPIRHNQGGMGIVHLFLSWFVLKTLQPTHIIESGVFQGLGTWVFEQAVPNAELHCIDLNLSRLVFKSPRARYYQQDFATVDWSELPRETTLLFFDDHQNAVERIKNVKWFGFRQLMFEDNFPPLHGDCYSLKMAFAESGFTPTFGTMRHRVKLKLTGETPAAIPPNKVDAKYLVQNLETYQELPPVFRAPKNMWGEVWNQENFPTPEPLLLKVERDYQAEYMAQAMNYHSICYARLSSK